MEIYKKSEQLSATLQTLREKGFRIGFVPTMGALHQGHISLIEQCKKTHDITVCSIFVNPTQFNNQEDLKRYPRTVEDDLQKLERSGCSIVFLPEIEEIYPSGQDEGTNFEFGQLENMLEGAFRPGHFRGVAQVVNKLLSLTHPHTLFLGQKDYQQTIIIEQLIQKTSFDTSVVTCPTMREKNGLAMSSRNIHLSETERAQAGAIYRALSFIKEGFPNKAPRALKDEAIQLIENETDGKVEYLEILDKNLSNTLSHWEKNTEAVACVAVRIGKVRLIDNILIPSSV